MFTPGHRLSLRARQFRPNACALLIGLSLLAAARIAPAQDGGLMIGPRHTGIAFGNVPRVTGIRFNFRDHDLERVDGANITIWTPYHDPSGTVRGLALGLPATGAGDIYGLAVGVFGAGASHEIRGIGVGGLGIGAGGDVTGVMVGGLGLGAGGRVQGIVVGGLGVGSGGALRGIAAGGLGVGSGGDVLGVTVGGLGVGAGGSLRGLSVGGLGVGSGGIVRGVTVGGLGVGAGSDLTGIAIGGVGVGGGSSLTGLAVGGIGVGAGSNARGLFISGVGVGAGSRLSGIAISGVGVGAPEVRALAIAPMVGGQDLNGIFVAPLYLRVTRGGDMRGAGVSALTHFQGTQHGVTIAVINHARRLEGRALQIGLLNYVRDNPRGRRLLPILNWNGR